MVVGETLMKLSGSDYFSPQFNRGGNAAIFSCECLQITASGFDIDVEHKNSEDTSWGLAGSFSTITMPGVTFEPISALKEQIRFKYTVTGSNAYDAVCFNMLAPSWRPY